jgi:hypothetical protein
MLTFILFLFTGTLHDTSSRIYENWIFFCLGTIGFLACFWFVRTIYAAVKIDSMDEIAIIHVSG